MAVALEAARVNGAGEPSASFTVALEAARVSGAGEPSASFADELETDRVAAEHDVVVALVRAPGRCGGWHWTWGLVRGAILRVLSDGHGMSKTCSHASRHTPVAMPRVTAPQNAAHMALSADQLIQTKITAFMRARKIRAPVLPAGEALAQDPAL